MDLNNINFILRDIIRLGMTRGRKAVHGADWFYFLHIPKTAGTSFRFSLYDYFPPQQIYPNTVEHYLKQKSQYISWQQYVEKVHHRFNGRKTMLVGHFGLNPLTFYRENPPKTLCFLRHPVNRVMSTIIYHRQKNRRFANLSVNEILDKHVRREGSLQSIYLGYDFAEDNWQDCHRQLRALDFIGISEQFDLSLRLCNRTFGWNLRSVSPRNVGRYSPSVFTPEHISRIEEITETDRLLYDKALRIFHQRCHDIGLREQG